MIRILLVIPLAVTLLGPPVASACPPDWNLWSPVGWSDSGALLLERDATHWDDEGSLARSEHYEVVQLGRNPRCIDLNGTSAEFLPCGDVRRVPMTDWYEDVDEPEGPTPVERMRNRLAPMVNRTFPGRSTRLRRGAVRTLAEWQSSPGQEPGGDARLTVALRGRAGWQPVFETDIENFYPGAVVMVALSPNLGSAWVRLVTDEHDRYESGWLVPVPPSLSLRDEDLAHDEAEITHPILPAATTRRMLDYAIEFELAAALSELRDSFGGAFWTLRAALWADPGNETLRRLVWSLHLIDPTILRESESAADAEHERTEDFARAAAVYHEVLWERVAETGTGDSNVDALLREHGVLSAPSAPVLIGTERDSRVLTAEGLEAPENAEDGFDTTLLLIPDAGFAADAGVQGSLASEPALPPVPGTCSAGASHGPKSVLTSLLLLALTVPMGRRRPQRTQHRAQANG